MSGARHILFFFQCRFWGCSASNLSRVAQPRRLLVYSLHKPSGGTGNVGGKRRWGGGGIDKVKRSSLFHDGCFKFYFILFVFLFCFGEVISARYTQACPILRRKEKVWWDCDSLNPRHIQCCILACSVQDLHTLAKFCHIFIWFWFCFFPLRRNVN